MATALAWLGVLIGGLVGMVTAMTVIGWFVPVRHTTALTLALPVPPPPIWQAISDFAGQPAWRKTLSGVARESRDDGSEVWLERHGRHTIRLRTVISAPPTRLLRRMDEANGPFRGEWDLVIEPIGTSGGSWVVLTERGEVPNPFFRYINRFVIGQARSIETYLTDLARRLNAPPQIQAVPTEADPADQH